MEQNSILTDCFTDIATAIREAEGRGSTSKIAPIDFASRIKRLASAREVSMSIDDGETAVLFSDSDKVEEYLVLVSTDNDYGNLTFTSGTAKQNIVLNSKGQRRFYCMSISRWSTSSGKWTYAVHWATYSDDDDDYSSYGSVGLESDSAELKLLFEDFESGTLYLGGYLS